MRAVVRGLAALAVLLVTVPSPVRADTPRGIGTSSSGANVSAQDDQPPVCAKVHDGGAGAGVLRVLLRSELKPGVRESTGAVRDGCGVRGTRGNPCSDEGEVPHREVRTASLQFVLTERTESW